jgi:phosphinothricin acetyltransferase
MPFTLRPAKDHDFDAITAIYAEAVAHGTASFELTLPDRHEMVSRHDALVAQSYPYLVLEDDDGVKGYAYAGPYRARPAYRFVVENSVYLDPALRGRGYGKALLVELIHACEALGFRQMIAVIGDSDNRASVALHRACGFEMTGTLKDMGWKHGRWLDTVLMQLPLGKGGDAPADLESVPGRMTAISKTP